MSQTLSFPLLSVPTDKQHAHGYFTGSGLPQRFCNEEGTLAPVFQLLTEWPDEFFADNGYTAAEVVDLIQGMLSAAQSGYFSAFVTNIHPVRYNKVAVNPADDAITQGWAKQLWEHAQRNGIPVWTSARFLDFTAARQSVQFANLAWKNGTLSFDVQMRSVSADLSVVVPGDGLVSATIDGDPVVPVIEVVAGRATAFLGPITPDAHVLARYS